MRPTVVDLDGFPCLAFPDEESAENYLADVVRSGTGGLGVSVNANKLHHFHHDTEFRRICKSAVLPTVDGSAAILGIRWLHGIRVARINMPVVTLRACAKHGFGLALVGGTEQVNAAAAAAACRKYPGLNLVVRINGYEAEREIIEELRSARPDVVLLGMGTPRQEILGGQLVTDAGDMVVIGCGGALDVLAGATDRAPNFVTRLHAEWFYRMLRQPRRIRVIPTLMGVAFRLGMLALRQP